MWFQFKQEARRECEEGKPQSYFDFVLLLLLLLVTWLLACEGEFTVLTLLTQCSLFSTVLHFVTAITLSCRSRHRANLTSTQKRTTAVRKRVRLVCFGGWCGGECNCKNTHTKQKLLLLLLLLLANVNKTTTRKKKENKQQQQKHRGWSKA